MEKFNGLTKIEVEQRKAAGQGSQALPQITKSTVSIIKGNICTLFNLLNFIIAILLFAAGAYSNMLFIGIIILNIVIGIFQELKAKKLVDELSILNRPSVHVIREGKEESIGMEDVVKDDIIALKSGDQICNDSKVIEGTLEMNESLLTGESDAIVKKKGSMLLSGSSVISGKALAKVVHAGNDNYATKLVNEVKEEKQIHSELLDSMKKVTQFTSFLIIPLGVLLFLEAAVLRNLTFSNSIVSSAAALLGMLPKGLVLLISVSLATGVIRLAKMKILIQNIYSLETLAHVDTICLDKTGTITDGKMKVYDKIPLSDFTKDEMEPLVESYMAVCDDTNATFQALETIFPKKKRYQETAKISFSSARKWGSVSFENMGTIFVGAPDKLLEEEIPDLLKMEMEAGRRVIVIGYYNKIWENINALPQNIKPLYGVILEDNIRKNAKKTLKFFKQEGVDVKIISGDHAKTVSMIAKKAGLDHWERVVDMSAFEKEPDYEELTSKYNVFARVTPKQKQELVKALKRQGHKVAMTGDGVNDLLALREADCAIAIADGSDASKQISEVVLLDSDFTNLPQVVMEGRKVVHNVTRTAGVFFIKTLYSVIVSLFCLIANVSFPFIPIQITLVDACIEAYPSFLTILESDTRKIQGTFLQQVLRNAAPFAVVISGVIAAFSLAGPFSAPENQTVMYFLLILISMTAVIRSCIPMNPLRAFLCITMVFGTFFAIMILPDLLQITMLTKAMVKYVGIGLIISEVILFVILKCMKLWKSESR